jgi:hypothetical protein
MEAEDLFAPVRPIRFRPALGDVAEALMQAQGAPSVQLLKRAVRPSRTVLW